MLLTKDMHQAGEIVFAKIYFTEAVTWPTLLARNRGETRAQLLVIVTKAEKENDSL